MHSSTHRSPWRRRSRRLLFSCVFGMMHGMESERPLEDDVRSLLGAGEARQHRLGELLEDHRRKLLRMVHLRMHPAIRQRVGASDVLQESWLEISRRINDYLANPQMPFHLWIRFITQQRLQKFHRFHIGAQKRDVRRQVSGDGAARPMATSFGIVNQMEASGLTPSGIALKDEARKRLMAALDQMNEMDREVLVLRHFEDLSNADTATELGIQPSAASKRYLRAVTRLRGMLAKG